MAGGRARVAGGAARVSRVDPTSPTLRGRLAAADPVSPTPRRKLVAVIYRAPLGVGS